MRLKRFIEKFREYRSLEDRYSLSYTIGLYQAISGNVVENMNTYDLVAAIAECLQVSEEKIFPTEIQKCERIPSSVVYFLAGKNATALYIPTSWSEMNFSVADVFWYSDTLHALLDSEQKRFFNIIQSIESGEFLKIHEIKHHCYNFITLYSITYQQHFLFLDNKISQTGWWIESSVDGIITTFFHLGKKTFSQLYPHFIIN